jgi:hypothetical protein
MRPFFFIFQTSSPNFTNFFMNVILLENTPHFDFQFSAIGNNMCEAKMY